jgi:hypothetical protein
LRARLGLQARIAIAGTIGAAHALAQHERNRVTFVNLYGEPDAMAPLAIAALRLEPYQRDGHGVLAYQAPSVGVRSWRTTKKAPPARNHSGAEVLEALGSALHNAPNLRRLHEPSGDAAAIPSRQCTEPLASEGEPIVDLRPVATFASI